MSRFDALALLVIPAMAVTACRVGRVSSPDAPLPPGDGLPDRIILDGPLPEQLLPTDAAADRGADGRHDARDASDGRADSNLDAHDGVEVADAGVGPDSGAADAPTASDASGAEAGGGRPGAAGCDLTPAFPGDAAPPSCPSGQACYPFPFNSATPTEARCGLPGIGGESVPCQSQLDCAETAVCSRPAEPDSVCLLRCDPFAPTCPPGQHCRPYARFPRLGTCA